MAAARRTAVAAFILLSLQLLALACPALAARIPKALVGRGALNATPDSLPGTAIQCTDFRTASGIAVVAQHLTAAGTVDQGWSPDPGQLCLGVAGEVSSSMVADGSGGAIVVWVDERVEEGDLYAQHFKADGTIATGWPAVGLPICKAPGSQYQVALAADASGGAFIAWTDFRAGSHSNIYAQHVTGDGQLSWVTDGEAVGTTAGNQLSPAVVTDGTGGALFIWQDLRADAGDIYSAHLGPNGRIAAGAPAAGNPVVALSGEQAQPRAVGDGQGGAIVTWQDKSGDHARLFALRLNPDGTPSPAWPSGAIALAASSGNQDFHTTIADTSGGAIVVWCDDANGYHGVQAQRVSSGGALSWGNAGVRLCTLAAEQYGPAAVTDQAGGVIAAWEDYRAGGEADIYAQRVTAAGQVAWDSLGVPVCVASGHQFDVALASDHAGGALATWVDGPASARASFLRARPVSPGDPPRLVSAESWPGRARLTWQTAPSDPRTLEVLRQATGANWSDLASLKADLEGRLVFEDRGLTPGSTVFYRLATESNGQQVVFGPTPVQIPLPKPLALRAVRLDATGHVLTLFLTLETDEPASVEVLDIQGRRMEAKPLGAPGAGDQILSVSLGSRLPSGIYFVRLHQGRATRTARLVAIQ